MSMPLRPGDPVSLGRYELVGRLGEGGMGTVYLGRSPDGRPVAIKMVRAEFAHEAEFRGRFRSEVTRAQQVPPFSTAEVLDADPEHDPPYLVVEFVDGPSLAAEIRQWGPMTGASLHGVAVGIATALTAIHGAGVIHRDLQPGTVLLARGGLKVIDFGIARAFEATSQHTRTDQMVGTVAYMAPERFDAEGARPVTAAADIFAWGAVVAYAATGRTPFGADSAAGTAMRILTREPDLTHLPESLRGPVAWALAKEPGDRPTARALLDLLLAGGTPEVTRGGTPVPAEVTVPAPVPAPAPAPVTAPARSGRGRTTVVLATLVAVLAAGGTGAAIRFMSPESKATARVESSPAASSAARPATSSAVSPSASAVGPPYAERLQSIMRGDNMTLIHVAEIDKDLALDRSSSEVRAGDGTGLKSNFALIPVDTGFLIRAMYDPRSSRKTCLGVRAGSDGTAKVVASECLRSAATVFQLLPTDGKTDDQLRPTYAIANDEYGYLQWNEGDRTFYVAGLNGAPPWPTFSFVDRGAVLSSGG